MAPAVNGGARYGPAALAHADSHAVSDRSPSVARPGRAPSRPRTGRRTGIIHPAQGLRDGVLEDPWSSRLRAVVRTSSGCASAEACPGSRKGADVQRGSSLETLRNMVASGLGITVLPASANSARYRSRLLRVVPFTRPAPPRRIALAWRRSYARTEAVDALAEAVGRAGIVDVERVQ